ncbi:MAG: ATP-binding protein [Clostridiales Family XIII bacterium]|jgi:AAA15 family ATPase/GTPase|nr:ATP-binding protein [Clostridiales Family XIII bacterium]
MKIEKLKIKNYRSFNEEQTLDFCGKESNNVTAIFGPNAGGKSNTAKALLFIKWFVINSANPNVISPPYEPFLLNIGEDEEPSTFTLLFTHENNRRFLYEFGIGENIIVSEKLVELSSSRKKTIFERDKNGLNATAAKFGFGKRMYENTRPGTLLITIGRVTNNEYSGIIFDFLMKTNVITSGDPSMVNYTAQALLKNPRTKDDILNMLREADFCIRDFAIEESQIRKEATISIKTFHARRDQEQNIRDLIPFDMKDNESEGTIRFFELASPIVDTLKNGGILYIDEFGAHLHPDISHYIVKKFTSKKYNPQNAQLIINTHDSNLMKDMNMLGRDNIILVEKNHLEESIIIPLSARAHRNDEVFEKRYRQGLYGAVPMINEAAEYEYK